MVDTPKPPPLQIDPGTWRQVRETFDAAVALPPEARARYVATACAGNDSLKQAVDRLLESHARAENFLETPPETGTSQQLAGRRVGPYQLVEQIGAGGMGEVYLAFDSRLGRRVAVKVLPAGAAGDAIQLRRFQQEARAASALNHPNILTVYETGEVQALHFIAAEHVEGETLRARLARGALDIPDVLDVSIQTASALLAAHQAGILHRDVKPENIMVRPDGYVKVLDFGIAKFTNQAPDPAPAADDVVTSVAKTHPGMVMGSPRYMSPEQIRGDALDARSDIFSFGVVLYEMIAGSAPFAGAGLADVSASILRTEPLPLSRYRREVPPPLQEIVATALEKDPGKRYQTMAEVLAALKAVRRELEFEARLSDPRRARQAMPRTRADAPRQRVTVGRDVERQRLDAALDAAARGHGQLMLVSGDAGMGKTTLVEEFLAGAAARGASRIGRGRCSERLAAAEAYLPILEALEDLLAADDRGAVATLLKTVAPTWYVQIAPLSADASGERLLNDARSASFERMQRELGNFLQATAATQPLVLFLDDLHWSDTATVDLLAFLATRFDATSVLIVGTYRTSDLLLARHPLLSIKLDLQARGLCQDITLEFLSRADVERYLALTFPSHRFPADFGGLLHRTTAGNPLFLVDLVRYLRAQRVIRDENGIFVLTRPLADVARELPESIRSLIDRKIERLSAEDHRLLLAASVQGYEHDSAVLARVLGTTTAEIEERLDSLERVHMLVRTIGEREFPDGSLGLACRFVHVLYQDALYRALKPARRAEWSRAVAEALVAFHRDRSHEIAATLAHLFDVGRDFERAVGFSVLAAQHASDVFAYEQATVLATRGLEMLKTLPVTPEHVQHELALQLIAGYSLSITKGTATPEMGASMTRAREICEQIGDVPQLFPVIWGLWAYYVVRADLPEALAMAQRSLRLADSAGQPELRVGAHYAMGTTLRFMGDYIAGHHHHEQTRALDTGHSESAFSRLYKLNPRIYAQSETVHTLWTLGYAEQAHQRLEETMQLARRDKDPRSLAIARLFGAILYELCGSPVQTLEAADACIAHCNEYGIAQERDWVSIWRGWAIAALGQPDDGIAQMRDGLATIRARHAEVVVGFCATPLIDTLLRLRRVADGVRLLDDVETLAERTGTGSHRAEFFRLRGELLSASGGDPEPSLLQAIERARAQGARGFELRAAIGLARWRQQQGRKGEARATLAQAYEAFTEGFDTVDLRAARLLLAELA